MRYETGLCTFTAGSALVSGVGTSWATYISAGDVLCYELERLEIIEVIDNFQVLLSTPWNLPTAESRSYWIEKTPSGSFFSAGQYLAIPAQPSARHVWRWNTHEWILPLAALNSAKLDARARVNSELAYRRGLPFSHDGGLFIGDSDARSEALGYILEIRERLDLNMSLSSDLLFWPEADGTPRNFTDQSAFLSWLRLFHVAALDWSRALTAAAVDHIQAIDQLTSAQDCDNYDATAGWP